MVKIIECPRDAMQGIKKNIPTEIKADYINKLLKIGFDTIDFGSFVSPKAIPQMADTAAVMGHLNLSESSTKLLAIVANKRGAEDAVKYSQITYLGYPFSVSETFQIRNTNATIAESVERVRDIQELCVKHEKQLVIYISMGFGNPYGDPWNVEVVAHWVERLHKEGLGIFALADTVGVADPDDIYYLFSNLMPAFGAVEFGAHLHASPHNWHKKLTAAWEGGCRRYDAAMKGFGGCPMANDELVGNMATENLTSFFKEKEVDLKINQKTFTEAMAMAQQIMG